MGKFWVVPLLHSMSDMSSHLCFYYPKQYSAKINMPFFIRFIPTTWIETVFLEIKNCVSAQIGQFKLRMRMFVYKAKVVSASPFQHVLTTSSLLHYLGTEFREFCIMYPQEMTPEISLDTFHSLLTGTKSQLFWRFLVPIS